MGQTFPWNSNWIKLSKAFFLIEFDKSKKFYFSNLGQNVKQRDFKWYQWRKKGGGQTEFRTPPPHLTINYNMIMIVDHLLSKFVSSQKVPTFFLDA